MSTDSTPSPLIFVCGLALAGCGGGSAATSPGGPPDVDDTAPFTEAFPSGGLYSVVQTVSLTSNEPALIYYTTDGSQPAMGGLTTFSDTSPLLISISNPLTLRFFGVDAEGNSEVVRSETYSFDLTPPSILLQGGLPTLLGFLEEGSGGFSVDDPESPTVAWRLELQNGLSIDSGNTVPGVLTTFDIPGWRLPLGAATTLQLIAINQAGGQGSVPLVVSGLATEIAPLPFESGALAITSDSAFLFIARPDEARILKYGALPGTPDYLQEVASIGVGLLPQELAISADDSRVFVTCSDALYEIEVVTDAVTGPHTLPGGVRPSGSALAPAAQLLYSAGDDGRIHRMNADPSSAGYLSFNSSTFSEPAMVMGSLALSSDGTRALLAWQGGVLYGVHFLDTELTASAPLDQPVPATSLPFNIATVAIDSSDSRAWVSDDLGKLARVSLGATTASLSGSNPVLNAFGITPAPDESVLLLTGGGLVGIRLADGNSLDLMGFVPLGTGTGGGTSRHMALSPDGKRAFLVRNQGSASAELQVLQLAP